MIEPNPVFTSELLKQLPRLRGFVIRLTRAKTDADDLLQDVALRAWANAHKFEITPGIETEMRSWLCHIAYRRWVDLHRLHRSSRTESLDNFDMEDEITESVPAGLIVQPVQDQKVWFSDVAQAFDRLIPIHQDALLLDDDYISAAAVRGIAEGTLKSRTNRARARLLEMVS